jgi:hypothetical protein
MELGNGGVTERFNAKQEKFACLPVRISGLEGGDGSTL